MISKSLYALNLSHMYYFGDRYAFGRVNFLSYRCLYYLYMLQILKEPSFLKKVAKDFLHECMFVVVFFVVFSEKEVARLNCWTLSAFKYGCKPFPYWQTLKLAPSADGFD